MSQRRLPVVQVDVFTDRPLEGNPLAVFTDAGTLTGEQMQALAREMNLSETTFVIPRDAAVERARGVRVRIFTVAQELPFAGHPTLGTAVYGGEDPATGSAAGCAAAWMVANGVAASDERVVIEQGLEIARPSRIRVRATREQGRVFDVRVGGQVVEVMRGEVAI